MTPRSQPDLQARSLDDALQEGRDARVEACQQRMETSTARFAKLLLLALVLACLLECLALALSADFPVGPRLLRIGATLLMLAICGAALLRYGSLYQALLDSLQTSRQQLSEALRDQQAGAQALQQQRGELERLVQARTAELQAEKQRMQDILEALPITLSLRDRASRYQQVNRMFEQALGRGREAVLGRHVSEVLEPTLAQDIVRLDAEVVASAEMRLRETSARHADGSLHDYLVALVPLQDARGEVSGLVSMGTDITPIKQLQRELSAAKDEALLQTQLKSAFIAHMSHELRTPLNAVLGFAELGLRRARAQTPERECFENIVNSGQHLIALINDVLDFSRLEGDAVALEEEPCAIELKLREMASLLQPRADEKGLNLLVQVDLPAGVDVMLDSLRFAQIMLNLLANAIKFTHQGFVRVHARLEGGALRVDVQDTGIGIAPDRQTQIFEPFVQAEDSTPRHYGGSGLGLCISRRLARLMGGEISLRSRPGDGSCFTLQLPWQPCAAHALQGRPARHERADNQDLALARTRLLVVDDATLDRQLLAELLREAGADVLQAENGQQALDLCRDDDSIDAVLMDLQMPVMDGLEATRRLSALRPQLPVIALTAHALRDERERCLEVGMREHLAKPLEFERLVRVLKQHLRGEARPDPAMPASAVAHGAAALPALPGVELDDALARCGGKAVLLARLMRRFAVEHADYAERLVAVRRSSLDELARQAHRLKGLSANLGMQGLYVLAAAVEDAVDEGAEPPRIDQGLALLRAEIDRLVLEVNQWLVRLPHEISDENPL